MGGCVCACMLCLCPQNERLPLFDHLISGYFSSYDELRSIIKTMRNHKKIKDMASVLTGKGLNVFVAKCFPLGLHDRVNLEPVPVTFKWNRSCEVFLVCYKVLVVFCSLYAAFESICANMVL